MRLASWLMNRATDSTTCLLAASLLTNWQPAGYFTKKVSARRLKSYFCMESIHMQRLGLSQNLQQKLSPQQIQFIKLLQVPTAELENRIEEELEINPALEEGADEERDEAESAEEPASTEESESAETTDSADGAEGPEAEVDLKEYLQDDDYGGYKSQSDGEEEERDLPFSVASSLHENLSTQLGFAGLD